MNSIVEILKRHSSGVKLKRIDETPSVVEASFFVEFENFDQLQLAKTDLKNLHSSISVMFMDNTRDY